MIRLGLRLALTGGREAVARWVLIVVAVGVGVGLLLSTLSGINAVSAQNDRYAWLETGFVPEPASVRTAPPLWWHVAGDMVDGQLLGRVDVAATGRNPSLPPGIPRLPAAGEFYASPALQRMMADLPAADLRDRFPGRLVGTIGDSALPSPDSLLAVVGGTVAEVRKYRDGRLVHAVATTAPNDCADGCPQGIGFNANAIDLILGVVTGALLFPVLVFIGSATRLSAARREQRFAAMRLVGATPRQVSTLAAVESCAGAIVGVGLGFVLFYLFRPQIASIPFTGDPFFVADLSPDLTDVLAIVLGVPVAAAVAARIALRRVRISPLGVSRRVTPRPPSAWRLLVLGAGLAELCWFLINGSPDSGPLQVLAYLSGILIVMAGLVYAGPWLTVVGTRLVLRRAEHPATLIAGRRLGDNPYAAFRAISGLVLALFVGTTAIAVITTFSSERGLPAGSAQNPPLQKDFFDFTATGTPLAAVASVSPRLLSDLRAVPGVTATVLLHVRSTRGYPSSAIARCTDLAAIGTVGRCPPGATTVRVARFLELEDHLARRVWPAIALSPAEVAALPVSALLVGNDGSRDAVERARTMIEAAYVSGEPPVTFAEQSRRDVARTIAYQRLADVVILMSLPIAGCSLAVSVVGGIGDRRRPFSLLRLSGVPLALLRRVVALESALPLLLGGAIAIGAGFASAQLFLAAQLGYSLTAPAVSYWIVVAAGLLASLAIIGSTLPVLGRSTGPEAARNE